MSEALLDPLPWLIVLPLAWGTLAFVIGPGAGARLAIAGQSVQLALALMLTAAVMRDGPRTHVVGGWGAPLGIDLMADGLSASLLLLAQFVALPLALYARAYFSIVRPGQFWPLMGYLSGALNALFLSADLFNLYVTLEMLSLAAAGMVALGGRTEQLDAALRYLLISLTASGAYLMGIALLYGTYGNVSIATLTSLVTPDAPLAAWLAAALMTLGLLAKTALFPFDSWLPPAHSSAAAPVSALLSALVVKAGFYLVLRLSLGVFAPFAASAETLLGLLGAAAIIWGSWHALRADRLKLVIAWSTVAQLGYLFLIFPLIPGQGPALEAGIVHAMAHGLAKAAMFAAAGVIMLATGRDTLDSLEGIAGRVPVTLFAIALAGVTLMGLPPSGGFLAKWLLIDAAINHDLWGWILLVIGGGLLTAAYIFRILRRAFLTPAASGTFQPVPRSMEWIAFGLAAASVALGVRAVEIVALLAPVRPI